VSHPRSLIRAAFVSRLGANLTPPPAPAPTYRTIAGSRVFAGRLMPIEEPELPAIVVHTRAREELLDRSTNGWNGFERRRGIVTIVCVAQSFDDVETDLDTMAAQVEAAIQSWVIPGFESSDPFFIDSDAEDPDFDGSLITGARNLRYAVNYIIPFRDCSNPYVDAAAAAGDGPLERSGAYPGGQVMPGCPSTNTGEVCPIGTATLTSNGERIN
jgi:hypothetical protein